MSVIGLRVGPFQVVSEAQVPEPGEWFRAERTGMTRRQPESVLVKVLLPDASGRERAALQSELDRLRAVEDPRVPAVVALYDGIGALALDAPDGQSLQVAVDARLSGRLKLSHAAVVDLGIDIAEALQHAHHRNHHHGHLSPEQVRMAAGGEVILFGFGPGPSTPPAPRWIPPETARHEPTTPATDQWSLAAILAALVTGMPPWKPGDSAADDECESLVEPVERQWPALARLLRRMLASSPRNRFPTLQPVRQELLALARKAEGTANRIEWVRALGPGASPDALDVPSVTPALAAPVTSTPATESSPKPAPSPASPSEPPTVPMAAEAVPEAEGPPSTPDAPPVAARSVPPAQPRTHSGGHRALPNEPLAVVSLNVTPQEEDDDDEDAPTVQFDAASNRRLMDEALRDDELADMSPALAAVVQPPVGGGPTVIPFTDPDTSPHRVPDEGIESLAPAPVTPRAKPRLATQPHIPFDEPVVPPSAPIPTEPIRVRQSPPAVSRVAPMVIGAMLVSMLLFVLVRLLWG